MIVVSDTSPLNYLILIRKETLLRKLFGRILIPNVVFEELRGDGAPQFVLEWTRSIPDWVEIKETHLVAPPSLDILDPGEREAILLAQEFSADLLLLDDRQARLAAADLGIAITGTLGILDRAAKLGLIDLRSVISELQKTNFYIAKEMIEKLLEDELSRVAESPGAEGE